MEIIEISTLIDITYTKVLRLNQGTQLELDQYRNFITLSQCIELRSIVHWDTGPTSVTKDIKNMGFGSAYQGKHTIWTFRFTPDREGVYLDSSGDPIGFLIDDIDRVPVIKNLKETINIDKAVFELKDSKLKNTIIKAFPGSL